MYMYIIRSIQWNPSITDTIGTSKLVLLIEVSFVERSFNIIKYRNGTRKVSLVVRCPLFRGVLYKGFHCNHTLILILHRAKPTNYLGWLLGHEGYGSVISHLKKRYKSDNVIKLYCHVHVL